MNKKLLIALLFCFSFGTPLLASAAPVITQYDLDATHILSVPAGTILDVDWNSTGATYCQFELYDASFNFITSATVGTSGSINNYWVDGWGYYLVLICYDGLGGADSDIKYF